MQKNMFQNVSYIQHCVCSLPKQFKSERVTSIENLDLTQELVMMNYDEY